MNKLCFPHLRATYALLLACVSITVVACDSDATVAPDDTPASLLIEGGDNQITTAGQVLPQPLTVRVLDTNGIPLSGVSVRFVAEDGGTTDPAIVTTGADGRASSRWTLGPAVARGETRRARAELTYASRTATIRFSARADEAEAPPKELRVLALSTYDGSGQTVHPDVLPFSASMNWSASWLLAVTPYPWGNATHENPSVYTSLDGVTFSEPRAGLNPVARPTAGHLSDPDIVQDPVTQQLRLYYREASDRNRIWLVQSLGLTQWSEPRLVASGPNHTIVSPSVLRASTGEWRMYAIDGEGGCSASKAWLTLRRSNNGVDWGAAQRVSLDQPGFSPWHVEVQWIPELREYWALYNVKTAGGCTTSALYLATSPDGEQWTTYPSPVLTRGAIKEFADIVYRASFHYDAARDLVTMWHSGARYASNGYEWRSAVETRSRAALFSDVRRKSVAIPEGTPGAPPLLTWP